MAFKFSQRAYDPDALTKGVWFRYPEDAGPNEPAMEVRIAPAQNPVYQQVIGALIVAAGNGTISDEEYAEMQRKATSIAVITDWRNVKDDEDNDLPYSPEAAEAVLSDPANWDFVQFVAKKSIDRAKFRRQRIEEDAEKLGEDSGGKPSGGKPSARKAGTRSKAA